MYNKIESREFINKYLERKKLKEEQELCCLVFIYNKVIEFLSKESYCSI